MAINWFLPLVGFLVGIAVGLTGIGGGVIMTPILLLGLNLTPSMAIGTDLAYATITKLVGAWQHWRQGTVETRVVRYLAMGSLPASLSGVGLVFYLRQMNAGLADTWLERAIAIALIIAALLLLKRIFKIGAKESGRSIKTHNRQAIISIGILGGFMVGLTSVGSGSIIMALLLLVTQFSPEKLVGTDITHAAILVGTAALAYFCLGNVDTSVVGQLLIGSVPGVILGSRLTLFVPKRILQVTLAGFLITSALQLLR